MCLYTQNSFEVLNVLSFWENVCSQKSALGLYHTVQFWHGFSGFGVILLLTLDAKNMHNQGKYSGMPNTERPKSEQCRNRNLRGFQFQT